MLDLKIQDAAPEGHTGRRCLPWLDQISHNVCVFDTAVVIGADMVSTSVKYVQQSILHRHAAVCLYVQVCVPPAYTQMLAPVFNITVAFQHGVSSMVSTYSSVLQKG